MYSVFLWEMFCSAETFALPNCRSTDYRNTEKPLLLRPKAVPDGWMVSVNKWLVIKYVHFPTLFLTHWIFPMHHKLSFSSVKWSRNRSKLMADLTCLLCWCATSIRGHFEALLLVLASPPWFKKDVFLVFSAKFLVKVKLVLRSRLRHPSVTAECREDQSGFWKQEMWFSYTM